MKTLSKLFVAIFWLSSVPVFSQSYLIPTHFDSMHSPPPPDYARSSAWAALPDKVDLADRTPQALSDSQAAAKADVFFIYPTTYLDKPKDGYTWNADVKNSKLNKKTVTSAILYQSTIFNGSCKVYAPFYRQAHYSVFLDCDLGDRYKALDLAYRDVRAAFEYYLAHYNNGRPIVIASHSQGTIHAERLLKEFFLNKPLQNKLVVAYLVGRPVIADSLTGIPPCRDSAQIHCFACWNTFERNYIPSFYHYGLNHSVCTNPVSWTLDETRVDKKRSRGAVVRPFTKVRPCLCDPEAHKGLLWISKPKFPGAILVRTSIYHSGDYNLFYMDVRENVKVRIDSFLRHQNDPSQN